MQLIRQLRRDFERHGGSFKSLGFWTMAVYHYGVWSAELESGPLRRATSKVFGLLQLGVEVTTGCTIHREARLADDVHLVHAGNIRIHPGVVIGKRCGIMHDVTIGTNMEREGVATIGDDVFIGAGAKILGKVDIGDGARIGANSLVMSDVPTGATALGVPARILRGFGKSGAKTNEGEVGAT